ncbi:MAG: hypothetical protein IJX30_00635 [Clostridia bacterium]|nr:hypothetical protein [Clostridia bacterium]
MKKFFVWYGVTVLLILIIGLPIFFGATKTGRAIWNEWKYGLEKVDEKTYDNQKEVEDTCRAMIASYTQDKMVYEQYKTSEVEEERSWANSAKIRANNTAATYNNYILKNSYVWRSNVPSDIYLTLAYLE